MVVYDTILIRYGELSTKGKNRKDFINRLSRNIQRVLEDCPNLKYNNTYDRIYIKLNGTDPFPLTERISKVFGISSFSLTQKVEINIEAIENACLAIAQETPTGTFKVVAHRSDKTFEMSSDEINRAVATVVLKNTEHKVNVKTPDFKLHVEVRADFVYITSKIYPAAGGYPVGANGKAMLLLSGGIDSPVAAYYVMKRGVEIEAIHFSSPPYTSTSAKEKVLELARLVAGYQGRVKVHVVPFTDLQLAIYKHCNESYAITIMRRMMVRIAERVARTNHCLALATGESLGQVASQTLESMGCINDVVKLPIIRPVVTFDKLEIIAKAKEIGTYETSILPYEDCCTIFTPKNPVTKPLIKRAEEYEALFDFESLIEECILNTECIVVKPIKEKESYL
ncbi:tRNA uracil 4-sulfurtransferase ThiI [Anaerorhabdus sp.]|uniref:tRNA uracil 4-sulfurtransferase ThiI n=1 Tax=Anaerorhabdus sp. TaxID=1872524 RepID=UPI002FCC4033